MVSSKFSYNEDTVRLCLCIFYIFIAAVKSSSPSRDSFIVLNHDTLQSTVDRVAAEIKIAKDGGYRLVTLQECSGFYGYM